MEVDQFTPPEITDGSEPQGFYIVLADAVGHVTRVGGESDGTSDIEVGPSALPIVGRTPFLMAETELALQRVHEAETELELVVSYLPQPLTRAFSPWAGDTACYSFFGRPILVWNDAQGHILGATGRETTYQIEVERVSADDLDFATLTSTWAILDANGEGIGDPSPPAQIQAAIDGSLLTIDYSQPAMRGRPIWGGLVPFIEVWRTAPIRQPSSRPTVTC